MKNLNIRKIAFILLDVILVLVIAGAVFFGVFGFNKSANQAGGIELRITLNETYHEDKKADKAQKDLENIIEAKYDLKEDTKVEKENIYKVLVFSIKGGEKVRDNIALEGKGSLYEQIKAYLDTPEYKFNEDEDVKEYQVDYVGVNYSQKIYLKTLISMAIILLATSVYFLIRFKVAATMASLCVSVIEMLLFISIILLTRIPVDGFLYVISLGILVVSMMSNFVYNSYFRFALKESENKTILEHANSVTLKVGKVVLSVLAVAIVGLLLAIIAVPSSVKVLLALIALGLLVVGVCSSVLRPVFRYWFGLINIKKKTGYMDLHAKQKQAKE